MLATRGRADVDLLLIDVETTGVDPSKDRVIEVAAAFFNLERAMVVEQHSWLVRAEENAAEEVNGIPAEILRTHPRVRDEASIDRVVAPWALAADAVAAHNAAFDRRFFSAEIRCRPWICTMDDVAWPRGSATKGLDRIAVAHGVPVVAAHRAMTDVDLLARLLERVAELGHNLVEMMQLALQPKARFIVKERAFSEERNELAKKAGFTFDRPTKTWGRFMRPADTVDLPFEVKQMSRLYAAHEMPYEDDGEQQELTA